MVYTSIFTKFHTTTPPWLYRSRVKFCENALNFAGVIGKKQTGQLFAPPCIFSFCVTVCDGNSDQSDGHDKHTGITRQTLENNYSTATSLYFGLETTISNYLSRKVSGYIYAFLALDVSKECTGSLWQI